MSLPRCKRTPGRLGMCAWLRGPVLPQQRTPSAAQAYANLLSSPACACRLRFTTTSKLPWPDEQSRCCKLLQGSGTPQIERSLHEDAHLEYFADAYITTNGNPRNPPPPSTSTYPPLTGGQMAGASHPGATGADIVGQSKEKAGRERCAVTLVSADTTVCMGCGRRISHCMSIMLHRQRGRRLRGWSSTAGTVRRRH